MRHTIRAVAATIVLLSLACSADDSASPGTAPPSGTGGTGGTSASGGSGATAGSGGSAGTSGVGGSDGGSAGQAQDPPVTTSTLSASNETFPNPERGFYEAVSLVDDTWDYDGVRDDGLTLVHSYVRLDDYRSKDLDAALLDAAGEGFQRARDAGLKVILRFAYNFGPYPDSEPDASKDWVLRHIEQLTPLLEANGDVIAVVQAGFIGAWGEWHSSTNGLLDDPQDKFDILEALLDAVPAERAVQVRYPVYKHDGYGGALTGSEAFTGTFKSRIGHHNDCFLASDEDWGTYPSGEIETWKDYLSQENLYVPMGGETCNPNPPRSECASALAEMQRLRFSYINAGYHPDVVDSWTAGGCRAELDRRVGYRLHAEQVTYPVAVRPGGILPLHVRIVNTGFAPPINPRPVIVAIRGPATEQAVLPNVEVRQFTPEAAVELSARMQLPRSLPEGTYQLGLRFADASPSLAGDTRYSIRLANDGVWDSASGVNYLVTFSVDDDAPGTIEETATAFEPL